MPAVQDPDVLDRAPGRRSLWRADILSVVALGALVLGALVIDQLFRSPLSPPLIPIAGIVLALVPAATWLLLFYGLDRAEPEPRRLVIGVFLLGALLAAGIGIPALRDVFRVREWLGTDILVQLAGSILVVGFIQEALKLAAVRFSVYDTAELDEMTDGVIYGTAAGLGYATVLSIGVVIDSGGVDLGLGAISVAVTALAHASFGGVVGYFLAGQKLQARPVWWAALGLALGAVLSGAFSTVRSVVVPGDLAIGGLLIGPLVGLLLGALLAALIVVTLIRLIRKQAPRRAGA